MFAGFKRKFLGFLYGKRKAVRQKPASIKKARKRFQEGTITLPYLKQDFFHKHKKFFLIAFFLLLVLTIGKIQEFIIIIISIFLGVLSRAWRKLFPIQIGVGVELSVFFTILLGILYGGWVGAISGLMIMGLSLFLTGEHPGNMLVSFFNLFAVGHLAPVVFAYTQDITMTGIALIIFYDFLGAVLWYLTGRMPIKIAMFVITHIIWNVFVFWRIAPVVFAWLV